MTELPGPARSRARPARSVPAEGGAAEAQVEEHAPVWWTVWAAAGAVVLGSLLLGFWPTLEELVALWRQEADYSHGFLVVPAALWLLWLRRDLRPKEARAPGWGGLWLLLGAGLVAYAGQRLFLSPLAGWALVIWLAGSVWLVAGGKVLRWSAPSLAFLFFAVPLPYRIETALSWKLQRISTLGGNWLLQLCGQPSFAEGNTIRLGEQVFDVERACSGLRMFIGIAALAFAFCVAMRRPWWHKGLLLASFPIVAMAANALRVAATALLFQYTTSAAAHRFAHDFAGWAMIAVATVLFGLVAVYLRYLIVEEELSGAAVLRRGRA